MNKVIFILSLAISASAMASHSLKMVVTCPFPDGVKKTAIVDGVEINDNVLYGYDIDKSDPKNPIFKEIFSAPAGGCFVEAQPDGMQIISAK